MVILTLLHPQTQTPLKQWRFEAERVIRVGRAPDNQVVVSAPIVSRYHLELRRVESPLPSTQSAFDSHWHLINHSTNGTFLGGQSITQLPLPETALLQLAPGGPILAVQITGAATTSHPVGLPSPQLPLLPKLPTSSPVRATALPPCLHEGNAPNHLFCTHCGQPTHVERKIRQYQVVQTLGRGGMGTTYLAWQPGGVASTACPQAGSLCVVKEMNADMAQIPKARELFEREASTLKTLNHPGIPRFYDFFIEAGKKYLVMELIHGQNLERRIRQKGPVSHGQAITWMIQTCEVLDYLHHHPTPVIHRDIKPSNLLVQSVTNRLILIDFGAVKEVGLPSGTRIGAEGFSAPEQKQGRPMPQSDLYAIGPCLVYILTGKSPLRFYQKGIAGYRLEVDRIPSLSAPLKQVINRVTEPDPYDRYLTARDLAIALSHCLAET